MPEDDSSVRSPSDRTSSRASKRRRCALPACTRRRARRPRARLRRRDHRDRVQDPAEERRVQARRSRSARSGVEKIYEDDLRGTPGAVTLEVDATGTCVHPHAEQHDADPGNDVQLTIDLDVQQSPRTRSTQGLLTAWTRTPKDTSHKKASRTSPRPAGRSSCSTRRNGEVIAMASYPTYDPTQFVNGIYPRRRDEALARRRAASRCSTGPSQGQYAPGSTFKLITANAALDRGLITREHTINDTGYATSCPAARARSARSATRAASRTAGHDADQRSPCRATCTSTRSAPTLWRVQGPVQPGIQDTARRPSASAPRPASRCRASRRAGCRPPIEKQAGRTTENPTAFPYGAVVPRRQRQHRHRSGRRCSSPRCSWRTCTPPSPTAARCTSRTSS